MADEALVLVEEDALNDGTETNCAVRVRVLYDGDDDDDDGVGLDLTKVLGWGCISDKVPGWCVSRMRYSTWMGGVSVMGRIR